MKSEKIKEERAKRKFIRFNLIMFTIIFSLFIIYNIVPPNIYKLRNPFIITSILPLLFFTVFSFIHGYISLIGNYDIKKYLKNHVSDKALDICVIHAYTGGISLIIASIVKIIIEKVLDVKIMSKYSYDIIGYIIGRIILLIAVDIFD